MRPNSSMPVSDDPPPKHYRYTSVSSPQGPIRLGSAGEAAGALRAIRRLTHLSGMLVYLSEFLQEEGRLAAPTGDTAGAAQAHRHYLALRRDPEPALRPMLRPSEPSSPG